MRELLWGWDMTGKKNGTRYSGYVLLLLVTIISCAMNPVDHEYTETEKIREQITSPYLQSVAEDSEGILWAAGHDSLYRQKRIKGVDTWSGVCDWDYSDSRVLIRDYQGSVIVCERNKVSRITGDDSCMVEVVKWFDNTRFKLRYTVDDSGMIFFLYFDFDNTLLLKWDGEEFTESILTGVTKTDSLEKTAQIAAGRDCLYLAYKGNNGFLITDKIIRGEIVERKSLDIDADCYRIDQIFAIDTVLNLLMSVRSCSISVECASGGKKVLISDEPVLLNLRDRSLVLRNRMNEAGCCLTYDLMRKSADEVYLYNSYSLFRIKGQSVSVKELYSDCGGLFLNNSGQVIMVDRYTMKQISLENLPWPLD